MKKKEIVIRDPYVFLENGEYYMYGSTDKNIWWGPCDSFSVYKSDNLNDFSVPQNVFEKPENFWSDKQYWAPEVHKYKEKYFMLASFFKEGGHRGSQILVSESPEGKFKPLTEKPFTPFNWDCLDATLYIENGIPYSIFCHEWTQIKDGEICVVQLSEDLKTTVGEIKTLFKASEAAWTRKEKYNEQISGFITDGPFLYKLKSKKLLMIWSSKGEKGYTTGMSVSDSGSIKGVFRHINKPLFEENGGHGMLFLNKEGKLLLSLHTPNIVGYEHPAFFECQEYEDRIVAVKELL